MVMNTLKKGRGGIKPGQIPLRVERDVPSHEVTVKGRKVRKKGWHEVSRRWVNPEKAIEEENLNLIDWEHIDKEDIRIPFPDEINPEVSPKIASRYFRMFYRGEEPNFERRLHRHIGASKLHPVKTWHKGEKTRTYHKDELIKFRDEYYGELDWLDQYHIETKTIPIRIGDYKTRATKYSRPKGPIVLVWTKKHPLGGDISYIYSKKHTPKPIKIDPGPGARPLNIVQRIFERELVKKALDNMIHLEIFRENIIKKANDLLNNSLQENHIIYNNFESGDNEVNLSGMDDAYVVQVNKIPVISTDNLQLAISKYYSEIGKIINSQNEDKDLALELLGERLITMNREIRPMIEKLGNGDETSKWLKDLDFSELDFDFDNNGVLKFLFLPSLQSAEPWKGAQVQMIPLQEEMGAGANGTGIKPGKKELKREDYKKITIESISQEPIDESDNPAIHISPVSVMS